MRSMFARGAPSSSAGMGGSGRASPGGVELWPRLGGLEAHAHREGAFARVIQRRIRPVVDTSS